MIRVLLADGVDASAKHIAGMLLKNGMEVAGIAGNGRDAVSKAQRLQPDILLMDINLADGDAVQTTAAIMRSAALPIVVMTLTEGGAGGVEKTFQAMREGALAAVIKPSPVHSQLEAHYEEELLKTARQMAEVKTVTRRSGTRQQQKAAIQPPRGPRVPVIAIGASTGGPSVLQTLLAEIPRSLPAALLIVQHISPGFVGSLSQWLQQTGDFPVSIAVNGVPVMPGHAYLAPENHHLGISEQGGIVLSASPPEAGLRPAVSHLFRSVTKVYGSRACGVLLTGMGTDGALELKTMRDSGGTTLAQDRSSSAIFGMPGRAIELDAAMHIGDPQWIARRITKIAVHTSEAPTSWKYHGR